MLGGWASSKTLIFFSILVWIFDDAHPFTCLYFSPYLACQILKTVTDGKNGVSKNTFLGNLVWIHDNFWGLEGRSGHKLQIWVTDQFPEIRIQIIYVYHTGRRRGEGAFEVFQSEKNLYKVKYNNSLRNAPIK